jgi:hypothetical protein
MCELRLSLKSLQTAARIARNDFTFVIDSERFHCDRFQAAFLSPLIVNALSADHTIDEFVITIPNTDSDSAIDANSTSVSTFVSNSIAILERLICGETVTLSESQISRTEYLCEFLGNTELNEQIVSFSTKGEELTVSNSLLRYRKKSRFGLSVTSESAFIASHFSEFQSVDLQTLKVSELEVIVNNETFHLESEDWFLDLILGFGSDYRELLYSVHFEFLGSFSINRFFDSISYSDVDERLWLKVVNRARHDILSNSDDIPLQRFIGCFQSTDSPFNGLIHHFTTICGGNVHERGVVEITSSSNGYNKCWQVADHNWTNYWTTTSSPNSWIQFDFKNRNVSLTHYTLKSDGEGNHHLLEWTIAGSREGALWDPIDCRKTQDLNGNYITKTFALSVSSTGTPFYRYIRLTQTGKNSSNYDNLLLAAVEFFGRMTDNSGLPLQSND